MRVAASTLGYLHRRDLSGALESLAGIGFRLAEISPTPPHLYMPGFGRFERLRLRRQLSQLGLECVSVNPTEINLVSTNPAYAELSREQLGMCLELAHDLGGGCVAFSPGRLFPLNPAPVADARDALVRQLESLVPAAERLGVVLAVETIPGFMSTGREVADVVDRVASPWLAATYDVANTLAAEPVEAGLTDLGARLRMVHISGAWRDRWAHTSVSQGDVDFPAAAALLAQRGYDGPTVYELVDGEDPQERMRADVSLLTDWGWEL